LRSDLQPDLHDEQRAKEDFTRKKPGRWNPYALYPQMRLLTYQMPDELLAIASAGEFDEFDLNAFFEASGTGAKAQFKHRSDVQKWLDIIRGGTRPKAVEYLKTGTRRRFHIRMCACCVSPAFVLVSAQRCGMSRDGDLLVEKHNVFWHDYKTMSRCTNRL